MIGKNPIPKRIILAQTRAILKKNGYQLSFKILNNKKGKNKRIGMVTSM